MKNRLGSFVISLDFEMMWGILDHDNPMDYETNIQNVRGVVPALLRLFREYNIHATWGVVGLLIQNSIEECENNKTLFLPTYDEQRLSSYTYFEKLKGIEPNYLFAKDLVELIQKTPGQEIATHTYSHYYCMEQGQTKEQFEADIRKTVEINHSIGIDLKTIIFPRNQCNPDYFEVLKKYGINYYRGNEKAWFYQSADKKKYKSLLRRGFRLLDNYIPLAGPCCYNYSEINDGDGMICVPSSRFFRPYSKRLAFVETIRLNRIKNQMKYAAKHGEIFHLWWHPHNFGLYLNENLKSLEEILDYYLFLNSEFDYDSKNIFEIGEVV